MNGEPIRPQPKPSAKPPKGKPKKALSRAECVAVVYARERGRCERCGVPVRVRAMDSDPRAAHVNERLPRSRGGDPCDPANCELVCQSCHTGYGGHAPTADRQRRLLDGKSWVG